VPSHEALVIAAPVWRTRAKLSHALVAVGIATALKRAGLPALQDAMLSAARTCRINSAAKYHDDLLPHIDDGFAMASCCRLLTHGETHRIFPLWPMLRSSPIQRRLWDLFDGNREYLNIAHECVSRHADGSGRTAVRIAHADGTDKALSSMRLPPAPRASHIGSWRRAFNRGIASPSCWSRRCLFI